MVTMLTRLASQRVLSASCGRALASSATSRAPLQVLDSIEGFRAARRALPPSATLGLVPTMGVRPSFVHPSSLCVLYT